MERCLSVQLVHCYISRLEGLTKPVARKATGIFFIRLFLKQIESMFALIPPSIQILVIRLVKFHLAL